MIFTSPSQILFTIFGLNIYTYGVILAIAISVAVLVADFIAYKYYLLKKETVIDFAPYIIIFGILGARLYYCLLDWSFYMRFPTEILALRHGGISIHGAILGGFIGLLIYAKRHKMPIFKLCDISAIGLSIGQAIGRWGNFFNSEAYGKPTDLPWKLYIAPEYRTVPYQNNDYFHPTFLYESICDLVIFFILFHLAKNKKLKDGNLALIYLILYSLVRIAIEYLRIDSVSFVFGIPVAIFMSVSIMILSIFLLYKNNKNRL